MSELIRSVKFPLFEESMKYSSLYNSREENNTEWVILKQRYQDWRCTPADRPKIPKIIHQIWLGKEMPSFEKKMTEQVKQNLGKDWQYVLWTEREVETLKNFKSRALYDLTPNYGQKSDLLRYAVLGEHGGVYLDTDFLLIGDFNDFIDLDFFCGVAYDKEPSLFNGLIGSTKDNPVINDLLILDSELRYSDAMSLMDSTGPYFLTRQVFKHMASMKNLVVFPNSFFYPLPNFEINKSRGNDYKAYLAPESICCHMWSSSWM